MKRSVRKVAMPERKSPFQFRPAREADRQRGPLEHIYGNRVVCVTDKRGQATPRGQPKLEIVLDTTSGFVPLWDRDVTLRWRFQERSLAEFRDPEAAKAEIRNLLGEALLAWGDAAPVKFAERRDRCDFEIAVRNADNCSPQGCVLASAFFPDAGQHTLTLYPKMFTQPRKEQVDTLIHEVGHIFGLRHFFAQVSETAWPSEVFGTHKPFSIMNYGDQSELTAHDRHDLRRLYAAAWSGELSQVNGTRIQLFKPFSIVGVLGSLPSVFGETPQPMRGPRLAEVDARVRSLLLAPGAMVDTGDLDMVGFTEPKMYQPRPGWRLTLAQWVSEPPGAPDSWQHQIATYWRWRTLDGLTLREAWKELGMRPATAKAALDPAGSDRGLIPPEVFSRVLARSRSASVDPDDDVLDVDIAKTPPTELPDDPEVGFTPAQSNPPRPPLYQPRAGWKSALGNPPGNSAGWLAQLFLYWQKRSKQKKTVDKAWEELRYDRVDARTALHRNLWDRGSIPPELIGHVVARARTEPGTSYGEPPVTGIVLYPELKG